MLMGTKSLGTSILVTQKWNRIVVVVVVGCLPRLAWMVTWESNCMMMMEKKKTRRAAAQAGLDGHCSTALHHSFSHSSHWPHGDVGPLSKLVLGVHTSVWIEV